MTDNLQFAQLLEEFRRVGVDPDTFSAVIAVTPDEALQVLRGLPDGAGPTAFLNRLRHERGLRVPPAASSPDSPADDGVRRHA